MSIFSDEDYSGVYPGLFKFIESNRDYVCESLLSILLSSNSRLIRVIVIESQYNSLVIGRVVKKSVCLGSYRPSFDSIEVTKQDEVLVLNHINNKIVKDVLVGIFREWSRDKKISKVLNEL